MKFKKMIAGVLAIMIMLTLSSFAVSATTPTPDNVTVKVDGKVVDFPDQQPIIVNDRTLVPVRFIAESLGYDVDWNPDDNSAVIDGGKIVLYIGTNKAKIKGKSVTLDVASTLINDRTMVPLRVIAEALDCTVDWFGTNQMVLVNKRSVDGKEMSVFERYKQSDLFWNYSTPQTEYLVWKADYTALEQASDPSAYHSWWIETTIDKSTLLNEEFDCAIVMRTFYEEDLIQVRDMLFTPYPTANSTAYEYMMQTITGEIWETFYREDSEWYPMYSAIGTRSGTFGKHYLDNREVEMYAENNGTQFILNISNEGYVNSETPKQLSQSEINFYTAEAKKHYCLQLWGLN
jgi:hypothetical protein